MMSKCRKLVVGDKGVGKSALIRRFTGGQFVEVNKCLNEKHLLSDLFSDDYSFSKCQKPKNPFCGQ